MIDDDMITNNQGIYILQTLAQKHKSFYKAKMMVTLYLSDLDPKIFSSIGLAFADPMNTLSENNHEEEKNDDQSVTIND